MTHTLRLQRRPLQIFAASIVAATCFAMCTSLSDSVAAREPAGTGPALAIEDTMHTEVPEVLVRAPRVTLDEILDRVARGEARRDSALHDQQFTAAIRVMHQPRGYDEPQLYEESVWRVYKRKPDQVRSVRLRYVRGKTAGKDDDPETTEGDFSPSMRETMVNFAFQPAARRDYRYKIVGRDLVGDHLIYRIEFSPRSPIVPLPSGTVWVDTHDYVIVRQEISFGRSPVPLLIKSLDRLVIERQLADQHWVLSRMLLRAEFTFSVPTFGKSMEFAIVCQDYANNRGIADSVFVARSRR
jgi:hypothetical protein